MFRNQLILAFRHLRKQFSFTLINVFGLGIGMAAFIQIFLYVYSEFSFDKFWPDSEHIYRITYTHSQNGETSLKSARALWGMAPVIGEQVPGVKGATQFFKDIVTVYNDENQIQDIQMFAADSSFFDVLQLNFVGKKDGNPLRDLYSSVLSESAAVKLFGTTDVVGKWFKVCQGWPFQINGVYKDLPQGTHNKFDMLLSWQTYLYLFKNWDDSTGSVIVKDPKAYLANNEITAWKWGYNGIYSYIKLDKNASPQHIESQINKMAPQYTADLIKNGGKAEFSLQPIRSIHLDSHLEYEIRPNGNKSSLLILAAVAFIILIIAWINFINLTVAKSLERARETGLRRVVGANTASLVRYYMIENCMINLGALFVALNIVLAVKMLLGPALGMDHVLTTPSGAGFWIVLLATFASGIVISGVYPAYLQASFGPLSLFRIRQQGPKVAGKSKMVLVVFQFVVSIVLIAGVITVFKQINFMRSQNLGIDLEQTIVSYSPSTMIGRPQRLNKLFDFKNSVMQVAGAEGVTTSSVIPGQEILWKKLDIRRPNDLPNDMKTYSYVYADHDFIPTFKLKLLAGRNFSDNQGAEAQTMIVNEAATKQLGFRFPADAVNSFVMVGDQQFLIIGIIQNYHQEALSKEIKPTCYFYGYRWLSDIGYYSIRIKSSDFRKTIAEIEEIWKQKYPLDHFEYFFLDESFNKQYESDKRFGILFTLFTVIAVFIACLGLLGMISYATVRRTKEIGIRKAIGAGNAQILMLLGRETIVWVLVSFFIAVPVAWFLMHRWLQGYAYRTTLDWWIFAVAGSITLLIAVSTVLWRSYKTAITNPVDSIRYE